MIALADGTHARRMEAIYRVQRHVYDLTRKYYLLGRDRLVERLQVPDGATVLEIGCGTGRNLALVARRYPSAQLHGLDISSEMLKSARRNIARAGATSRTILATGDATAFDPEALFEWASFDRIFLSYTLSMIPDWRAAITAGVDALAPGGELHIVDFGQQRGLPGWFRPVLRGWLARFHVTPRAELFDYCADLAAARGYACVTAPLYRDYAWSVTISGRGGA
jgi:S-adenosylmethionine-diacylgycerolhomoserine-N-methlytransferase